MVFDHLSYRELIEDFFNDFLIEYGKLKFEKINKKVQVSNKISNLIYISKQKKVVPNKNDFLFSINSIIKHFQEFTYTAIIV